MPYQKADTAAQMVKELPLPRCNCGNLSAACAAARMLDVSSQTVRSAKVNENTPAQHTPNRAGVKR